MKKAYNESSLINLCVFVVDWVAFNLSLLLSCALGFYVCRSDYQLAHWLVFNIAYIISVNIIQTTLHHRWSSISTILRNVFCVSLLTLLINAAVLGMAHLSAPGFFRSLAIMGIVFVVIVLVRWGERKVIGHIRSMGLNAIRAIVIGTESLAGDVIRLMSDKWNGYNLVGLFYDVDVDPSDPDTQPVVSESSLVRLGGYSDVLQWLKDNEIDEVYICLTNKSNVHRIRPILRLCTKRMVRVYYIPNSYMHYSRNMRSRIFGDTYVLTKYNEPLMNSGARVLKRTFDIVFSAVFLCTIFLIILVVVTIVTKVTMPGPVFFRQRRTGYDGKEFWCYKFRSMKVNNEADTVQATKDDDRVTRWGKILRHTNIDETPQFWNVFIGDMSVVGPRPHMLAHTEYYSKKIGEYMIRHYVRPGITGWAQTHGERGQTETVDDMRRRVECDIWYIEHWSFWLDLQIIIKTIELIIVGDDKAF